MSASPSNPADSSRAEFRGRPLRILMLAHYFPKPGNRLMGVWALAQAQAFQRAGVEITVVSFTSWIPRLLGRLGIKRAWAECPPRYDWGGLTVLYPRWPLYWFGPFAKYTYRTPALQERLCWMAAGRRLERLVRDLKPDVIFTHHSLFNGAMARRLRDRHGVPYTVTEHDHDEISACERFPERRRVMGRSLLGAHTCVCFSERMQADIQRLFPGAATRLIRNGSDPIPREICQRPRPDELRDRLVVFSAAFFYERKGMPLLVRAFAQVAPKYPGAILRIAGRGDDLPKVEAAIAETGMAERVQLLGPLHPEQVRQEMVWADLFALPAWNEPFGIVYLEAASAGKPLIWSRDGGIGHVLRDGLDGVAVEPRSIDAAAAALDRLLADEALRQRMGRSAQETFQKHLTWDGNAQEMIRLFREAAAGASQAPAREAGIGG